MTKNLRLLLSPVVLLLALCEARAVPFEPTFSDYSFPGTQYTVDAPANAFFAAHYGITISNAYLYKDSRDTFDGIGVSVGTTSEFGTNQTGRIDFLDSTDFVSLDYWTIKATTYQALDGMGNVIETLSLGANLLGTHLFSTSDRISAVLWSSETGYGQVTGLRYDFDGTTDGHNDDLDNGSRVPDISNSGILLIVGLGALCTVRRRFSK